MNYVYANSEPKKVEYHKLSDGRAFVLLHKDIEQVDVPYQMGGETVTQKMWRCHEKQYVQRKIHKTEIDHVQIRL